MTYRLDIEEESQVRLEGSWGATSFEVRTMRITAWVNTEKMRGGFEIYDIETGGNDYYAEGGLWFNAYGELVDYDGVFSLDSRIEEWCASIVWNDEEE